MEQAALKKMRSKQVVTSNLLFGMVILIFFILIQNVEIQFTYFFLCLGIFMLLQGIYGLIKKGSTKSIIPIFEQVAIYEKEKLGKELEERTKSG
ncbi:hypothetical protein [Bacillus safensis]|uniref:hypothetical protein n=1 Tax=Bacillus safensis TaxID=561879 RepID=UPI00228122EF|nr:hypothetical protein [Bacillus safensis]MCY7493885.1 hypothetical protein [Bacillus safensis]MED4991496.1 hypothetical protein [Bacillus safensis]